MDTKSFSAYNEASKKSLSAGLLVVDAAAEPLKVLKVLMEGLPPRVKDGLLIARFKGIPVARAHTPFDLIYLDSEDRVLQAVEISQRSVFEPFKGIPASALVLRAGTIRASKTFTGDHLLFTALEEEQSVQPGPAPPAPPPRPVVASAPARVVSASTARSFNVPTEHVGTQGAAIHSGPLLRSAAAVHMPAAVVEEAAPEKHAPAPEAALPAAVEAVTTPETTMALPETPPAPIAEEALVVAVDDATTAAEPEKTIEMAPVGAAEPAPEPTPVTEPAIVLSACPEEVLANASEALPTTAEFSAPAAEAFHPEAELPAAALPQEADSSASVPAQTEASGTAAEPTAEIETIPAPAEPEPSPLLDLFAAQSAAGLELPLEVPDDALTAPPVPSVPSTAYYSQIDHARQSQTEFLQLKDQLGAETAALAKRWDVRLLYFFFPKLDPNYRAELQMPQIDYLKKAEGKQTKQMPLKLKVLSWLYPDLHLDTVEQRQKEVRRSPRLPIPNLVGYFYTGGTSKPHEIRNLSLTGFYMITDERYLPGTIVRITLQMKGSAAKDPLETLTLHTRVVHWGPDGSGFEFVLPGFMDSEKQ